MRGPGLTIWRNLGFSAKPKDTSTCGRKEIRFKLSTLCSMDDQLYLLCYFARQLTEIVDLADLLH